MSFRERRPLHLSGRGRKPLRLGWADRGSERACRIVGSVSDTRVEELPDATGRLDAVLLQTPASRETTGVSSSNRF